MMPDVAAIVHPLVAVRQKHLRPARAAVLILGDDDEKRTARDRRETLAAERMALHHGDFIGEATRLAAKEVDDDARILARRLSGGERMETLRCAAIDEPHCGRIGLDHLAEG